MIQEEIIDLHYISRMLMICVHLIYTINTNYVFIIYYL